MRVPLHLCCVEPLAENVRRRYEHSSACHASNMRRFAHGWKLSRERNAQVLGWYGSAALVVGEERWRKLRSAQMLQFFISMELERRDERVG